jgi:hypothetical protein
LRARSGGGTRRSTRSWRPRRRCNDTKTTPSTGPLIQSCLKRAGSRPRGAWGSEGSRVLGWGVGVAGGGVGERSEAAQAGGHDVRGAHGCRVRGLGAPVRACTHQPRIKGRAYLRRAVSKLPWRDTSGSKRWSGT